ncbi:TolC family protein [Paludisphaera borealis]|uniref:Cobalt-zinc-cadmium resistance protein CzcC n=1 Tax=Paludisphaera borealis TaxID=1387353 RepID=A0A1U7CJC6_9BACT|nr:TolC family protein [Paludisphaera borealis]APW58983.1 Cobalt-zinc-cadmium resistance protein CzcC [Paludisphaera borealis]
MNPFLVRPSPLLLLAVVLLVAAVRAPAQGTSDSEGSAAGSSVSRLGRAPGSGGGSLGNSPNTGQIIGGRPGISTPKGIPTSVSTPEAISPTLMQQPIAPPESAPISGASVPLFGVISIPEGAEDDGPADGVTLDAAIATTLNRSLDLRSKFFEIPQAKADTLQASLRANPVFYADAQLVPFGQFNRAAPGGPTQYDVNVTYPLDVTRKRQARTQVAMRAERVLEAQYQEAVRQRIDDVYDAFVFGVLAARQTVRYAQSSVKGLQDLTARTEQLHQKGGVSLGDLNRIKNQYRTARLGLIDAQASYRKAKLEMGSLMNLTRPEIEAMSVRGTIQDDAPPPPPVEEMVKIALAERPDIVSFRLGLHRAEADVRLARANRLNDVFVLAQPFTYQDNTPYGLKSAYSWALGVTVPLPVYNRNQGGIQRAVLNVDQTKTEIAELERQIAIDVEKAAQEYAVTRQEVDELKSEVIPAARQVQQEAYRLYLSGETSIVNYINAQLDFNQVAKQYLDTAIRHRRSMLDLNTVTGKRIMP